jgi:hypothetical protein
MKTLSLHAAMIAAAFVIWLSLAPQSAYASCGTDVAPDANVKGTVLQALGDFLHMRGSCTEDDEELIITPNLSALDACMVMSATGAVDVYVSLDGTTYSTTALSLQDFGATDLNPVNVTAALRMYGFVGKYQKVKIVQNGATDAAVSLNCWKL